MYDMLINCIKGNCEVRASGRFPERILNIASTSGIFIRDVRRYGEDSIVFCVGKKGCEKLFSLKPDEIEMTILKKYGLPFLFQRHKRRILFFSVPALFLSISFFFSLFIWRIEIEGGDKMLQDEVIAIISENGVHRGALKRKIDQNNIKRTAILSSHDLSWMWVDIKGTTAKVKIHKRAPVPKLSPISEPADVISTHSGRIEKMQVYCGVPLCKEGDFVKKEQLLITGIFRSENENIPTYYHHASGNVVLRLFEEQTFIIPRITIKKTPTGEKKSVFRLNFEKNNVNFSFNSGISYAEYDKIEKKYALPLLPVAFYRTGYFEMKVEHIKTDIDAELEKRRKSFISSLEEKKLELVELSENITENEQEVCVTFSADCRVRADKEIPILEKIPDEEVKTHGENS